MNPGQEKWVFFAGWDSRKTKMTRVWNKQILKVQFLWIQCSATLCLIGPNSPWNILGSFLETAIISLVSVHFGRFSSGLFRLPEIALFHIFINLYRILTRAWKVGQNS
jgi:hypothetical protein